MRHALIIVAAVLSLLSGLPYIIDVARNKTHPNLVTWFTWMVVITISAIIAASDGATNTAILNGTFALTDLPIIILGLKHGVKRYTPLDVICQLLAVIGIVLWRVTGNAEIAAIFALVVLTIAVIPTWRHAWKAPFEETWQGFALSVMAALLTILSLPRFTFIALSFPLVSILNCGGIVAIVLGRRKLTQSSVAGI